MTGLLVVVLLVTVGILRWRNVADDRLRARWDAAISSAFDPTRDAGWLEKFSSDRTQPLSSYDPRWKPIFGSLLVDSRRGAAVGDPANGWHVDGGDDYAFRAVDVPFGSVEIVLDGWWTGDGSLSAIGAVQSEAPHRFYEAALWRRCLTIIYFYGPSPTDFEVLSQSPPFDARPGHYRIVFLMRHDGERWAFEATALEACTDYTVLARVAGVDGRLGVGAQGMGILSGGGTTHVTGVAVKSIDNAAQ